MNLKGEVLVVASKRSHLLKGIAEDYGDLLRAPFTTQALLT